MICGVGAAKRHNNGDKIDVIGSSIHDLMSENDWGVLFKREFHLFKKIVGPKTGNEGFNGDQLINKINSSSSRLITMSIHM